MQLYALDNAHAVARRIVRRADGLRLAGAAATAVLAKEAREIIEPLVKDEAPRRTGALAAGLHATTVMVPGGALITVDGDVPYLPYVVEGTGIYHRPDPHSAWDVAGLQRFEVAGETVFARSTHHLGQKPDDFPDRALRRAQPALEAVLLATGPRILVGFVGAQA